MPSYYLRAPDLRARGPNPVGFQLIRFHAPPEPHDPAMTPSDAPDPRIDLESKLAFLERTVEELSAVVNEEALARQALETRLARLEQSQKGDGLDVGPHDDPPPHY